MTLAGLQRAAKKIITDEMLDKIEDIFFAVIRANDGSATQNQINFISNKICKDMGVK